MSASLRIHRTLFTGMIHVYIGAIICQDPTDVIVRTDIT